MNADNVPTCPHPARRSRRAAAAVATTALALVAGGAAGAGPAVAAPLETSVAGQAAAPPPLPTGTPTPDGNFKVLGVYKVVSGVQSYTCTSNGDWGTNPSVPQAQLRQYNGPGKIQHFAGPRWKSEKDGSTVLAAVDTTKTVQQPGTIPWLLLNVTAHEVSGPDLDAVTNISRVNTTGGLRPTGSCTAGTSVAVPYTADYVFWVPGA